LSTTSRSTSEDFVSEPDLARLGVRELAADDIVDGELDGLLRRDADKLGEHARVEALKAFVLEHLSRAVYRVLVQSVSYPCVSLILHSRLDEIDGVHHERAESTCYTTECEVMCRLEDVM